MEGLNFNEKAKCVKCGISGSYGEGNNSHCGDCIHWDITNFDGNGYIRSQIAWFADLKDLVESGETETAACAIDAAIKLLSKQIEGENTIN